MCRIWGLRFVPFLAYRQKSGETRTDTPHLFTRFALELYTLPQNSRFFLLVFLDRAVHKKVIGRTCMTGKYSAHVTSFPVNLDLNCSSVHHFDSLVLCVLSQVENAQGHQHQPSSPLPSLPAKAPRLPAYCQSHRSPNMSLKHIPKNIQAEFKHKQSTLSMEVYCSSCHQTHSL